MTSSTWQQPSLNLVNLSDGRTDERFQIVCCCKSSYVLPVTGTLFPSHPALSSHLSGSMVDHVYVSRQFLMWVNVDAFVSIVFFQTMMQLRSSCLQKILFSPANFASIYICIKCNFLTFRTTLHRWILVQGNEKQLSYQAAHQSHQWSRQDPQLVSCFI